MSKKKSKKKPKKTAVKSEIRKPALTTRKQDIGDAVVQVVAEGSDVDFTAEKRRRSMTAEQPHIPRMRAEQPHMPQAVIDKERREAIYKRRGVRGYSKLTEEKPRKQLPPPRVIIEHRDYAKEKAARNSRELKMMAYIAPVGPEPAERAKAVVWKLRKSIVESRGYQIVEFEETTIVATSRKPIGADLAEIRRLAEFYGWDVHCTTRKGQRVEKKEKVPYAKD